MDRRILPPYSNLKTFSRNVQLSISCSSPVSYTHLDVYKRQHLTSVQTIIQRHYEYAFYIHCYAHQLNLVIARAASQNQQVRIFFTNLSNVTNFFSNSPQRAEILDNIVGKRIPRASSTRWTFKSRTVNTVFEHREDLITCMKEIESTSKQESSITKAGAIR